MERKPDEPHRASTRAMLEYEGFMEITATHPGEHLAQELKQLGMGAGELARQLERPTDRVTEILSGQRAVTADMALPWVASSEPARSFG